MTIFRNYKKLISAPRELSSNPVYKSTTRVWDRVDCTSVGRKNGLIRGHNLSDPVYALNSKRGPRADDEHHPVGENLSASDDMVRNAYTLRSEDEWPSS